MIKKYNNGKVITDGNLSSPNMINASRFSFPIENEPSVQIIEQDYIVRAESFTPLNFGSKHPVYTDAVFVTEGNFSSEAGGLVRFTRTFLRYPSSEIILPITSNVSFPQIKDIVIGQNAEGETVSGDFILRNAFSKVVPCEQRVQFVDILSLENSDSTIAINDIEVGSRVIRAGEIHVWIVSSIGVGGISVYREDDSSITNFFYGSQRGTSWSVQTSAKSFAGITISSKFTPIIRNQFTGFPDGFTYTDGYTGETVTMDAINNPVDYVSSLTVPSISEYISQIENGTMIRIEDTKIEHYMGTIYKVINTLTKAL